MEGQQHTAHRRARPAGTARKERHAPMPAREGLDDETGFLVRVGVEHVPGLMVGALFHSAVAPFLLISQLSQDAGVIRPGTAHFHPHAEVDLALEETLEIAARRRGHGLQALAALAEDDGLLAPALDEDGGLDAPQGALLLEAVDHHLAAVREFLAKCLEELLAQALRGEKALVAVG